MSMFRKKLTDIKEIIRKAKSNKEFVHDIIPQVKRIVEQHYKDLQKPVSRVRTQMERSEAFRRYGENLKEIGMICENIDYSTGHVRGMSLSGHWWDEIEQRVDAAEEAIQELERDTKALEDIERKLE